MRWNWVLPRRRRDFGKLAEPVGTGSAGLSLGADGEDMPTLCPPLRQDFPSARAFHAGTESVHFGAAAPIRLKRSLGHSLSPLPRGRPPGSSHRGLCHKNTQFISRLARGSNRRFHQAPVGAVPFLSAAASGPSSSSSRGQAGHAPEEAASTGPAIARKPPEAAAAASPSVRSRS